MKLAPLRPPGRKNTKARGYQEEIGRLRQLGYTCEAIREALAAIGVEVSRGTVQREGALFLQRQAAAPAPRSVSTAPAPKVEAQAALPVPPPLKAGSMQLSREYAEEYFNQYEANSLIRKLKKP